MAKVFLIPHAKISAKQIEVIFKDNLDSWQLHYDQKYKVVILKRPPTEDQMLFINLVYEEL